MIPQYAAGSKLCGDNAVDETLHVVEVNGAHTLCAQAIGDGARDLLCGELHDFSSAQAGLRVCSQFGFDAEDVDGWLAQLDGRSEAADEASTADWGENSFDVGHVFEDLESHGALAGNDFFVVVWGHDDVAVFCGQFLGLQLSFGAARAYQYDVGAQGGSSASPRCSGFWPKPN